MLKIGHTSFALIQKRFDLAYLLTAVYERLETAVRLSFYWGFYVQPFRNASWITQKIVAPNKWWILPTSALKSDNKTNSLRSGCNFPESGGSVKDSEWYPIRAPNSKRLDVMVHLILECQIPIFRWQKSMCSNSTAISKRLDIEASIEAQSNGRCKALLYSSQQML